MDRSIAYHGYLKHCKSYLHSLPEPSFLEVGVDNGATFVPLYVFLLRTKEKFWATALDIKIQDHLKITLDGIEREQNQVLELIQNNSLVVLPQMVETGRKYDLVLLDGDHNYHTVSQELALLPSLTHNNSLVIIDDYAGRWAERDLWYAQRPGYEDVKVASQPVDTEKHGVKTAVDEFLATHLEWLMTAPIPGEPVVLIRNQPFTQTQPVGFVKAVQ